MNKFISLGLALLFSCSFFSCGDPDVTGENSVTVEPKNPKIGDDSDKNSVVSGTEKNNQVVPELDKENNSIPSLPPQKQVSFEEMNASSYVCSKGDQQITYTVYKPGVVDPNNHVCELDVSTTPRVDDWRANRTVSYCDTILKENVQSRETNGWTCSAQ